MKPNEDHKIEIKLSKNGLEIPVVDGILLHSIYNPLREARKFVQQNKDTIAKNSSFLILGCGFGYHLGALLDHLEEEKVLHYEIYVIEPITELYNQYISSSHLVANDHIHYLVGETPQVIFENPHFVHFLLTKPSLLSHPASFNLSEQYFSQLLQYKAPEQVGDFLHQIDSPDLHSYFSSHSPDCTINEITRQLENNHQHEYSAEDFFLLALNELQKTSRLV